MQVICWISTSLGSSCPQIGEAGVRNFHDTRNHIFDGVFFFEVFVTGNLFFGDCW